MEGSGRLLVELGVVEVVGGLEVLEGLMRVVGGESGDVGGSGWGGDVGGCGEGRMGQGGCRRRSERRKWLGPWVAGVR